MTPHPYLILVILLLLSQHGASGQQLTVSLLDTAMMVTEGSQFGLRIQISQSTSSVINVIVDVKSPTDVDGDFIGTSQVGSFYPNGPNIVNVTFTVNDDTVPETEETFTFELKVITAGVILGQPNIAAVTIAANDDAYGVFSFQDISPVLVTEADDITSVNLMVGREKGTFGNVTVKYEVSSSTLNTSAADDISPVSGSLLFLDGKDQNVIPLQILPDDIPENNEVFTVTLTDATAGARVDGRDIVLIIQANDAPVRFQQSEYRFDEEEGEQNITLYVLRGIDEGGQSRIGSVNEMASVDYFIIQDTATEGVDFRASNGQVVFFAGQTSGAITFTLLNDTDPEMEESFEIMLTGAQGKVLITFPSRVVVKINANDNPNGVISFLSPNNVSLPMVAINEDTGSSAIFTVVRNAGRFGVVSVTWEVFRNDSNVGDVTSDISIASDVVVFQGGQTEQKINITSVNDIASEPTERFIVKLMPATATGGAKVEGITMAVLLIEDSDNYYGTVEFKADSEQTVSVSSNPRILQLALTRTGYNYGNILVTVTVSYTGRGQTQDVLDTPVQEVLFTNGQDTRNVQFPILASAFLQVGDEFSAMLSDPKLQTDPPLGSFNTPSIGGRRTVDVPVTISVANGEIGFQSTQTVYVSEPESSPRQVSIQVTREGTSGRATIDWVLQGSGDNAAMVTSSDVGTSSGTLIMDEGRSEVTLIITVMPDDIPEIDEEVTVTLTSVLPADTQRLKSGSTQVKVIITENDNPGGTMQFSPQMQSSYEVKEDGATIEVIVERIGGDLLTQYVQYIVIPNGEQEFYGATNVLKFDPGVRIRNSTLLAKADGVPELMETFTLTLQSFGNVTSDIGSRSSITINVTENDDPYGVVQFQNDPAVYVLDESFGDLPTSVAIPLVRTQGLFGTLIVKWQLTPSDGVDLIPVSGTVTFGDRQDKGFVSVETVKDNVSEPLEVDVGYIKLEVIKDIIPEPVENFTIQLEIFSGMGRIGSPNTASVSIKENDFALYFLDGNIQTVEPAIISLVVKRDGPATDTATMRYQTVDGTASSGSTDYRQIVGEQLVFNPGETEKTITVEILNDDVPEGNETFYVRLFDIQGDVVLTHSANATITILANDDAYGVFSFEPPRQISTAEGSTADFEIIRRMGRFGVVDIEWEIYDTLLQEVQPDGGDFMNSNGTIRFLEQDFTKKLELTPRKDGAPELQKKFIVRLKSVIVIEGRTDIALASLATTNTEAELTVLESDDPYGKFAFNSNNKAMTIAEDYYAGQEASTKATFVIQRQKGIFGTVEVSWEIFTKKIADSLPKIYDLIFLAQIPNDVSRSPSKRREFTGTDAIQLTGALNQYLTIEEGNQPNYTELQNGYTISAWVQPLSSLRTVIVAKTTNGGSRNFYTLKLETGTSGSVLFFGFSVTGDENNKEISVTTPANLLDDQWHHILVTAAAGVITFYVDGSLIGTKLIGSQPLIDLPGTLLVGAISPGSERYVGYLQDVKILTRKLTESEIQELYNTPAKQDVIPVSGYLVYLEGMREKDFTITSLQDTVEESDEEFSIMLIGAKNGATLSANDSDATLTVLKSDNANGVFGFTGPCSPAISRLENEDVLCIVTRTRGDVGVVNVTWIVYRTGSQTEAVDDFVTSSGMINFNNGDRTKTFTFKVKDDAMPENLENFEIRLTGVLTGDGTTGSTNTSGASIDLATAVSNFVIDKTDNANGLVQFSNSSVHPNPADGMIQPATEVPVIHVSEESQLASLVVVRAQGSIGDITVEWRTADGTAKSSGKAEPDYEAGAGQLTFTDGQLYDFINIKILNNVIPEDQKLFYVNLFNPTGGAVLGIASTVTVVIEHSDGAYGVFQFADESLSVQAIENGDSGYSSTALKVIRTQGSIGTVPVSWELTGNPENDVISTSGSITFQPGDLEATLFINVRGDTVPELDKTYPVVLTGASPGLLGPANKITANVTILANDNPYGVFVIPSSQRPLLVEETYTNVSVTVQRQGGSYGAVDVYFRTLSPNETYPYFPSPLIRAGINDFRFTEGAVRFLDGQTNGTLNIVLLDDIDPETDESFFVMLDKLVVVTPAQARTVTDSPILGQSSQTYAQVIIRSNDNAHGTLDLSPLSATVEEKATAVPVTVERRGGTFGQVSVKFRVVNGTAFENFDFVVMTDTVVFPEGVSSRPLPIQIIDDSSPEQTEIFYVELQDPVTGGAVLGSAKNSIISILSSDDPVGAFEFLISGLVVEEPESGSLPVTITIERKGGSMGVVTLQWQATLNGATPSADMIPTAGSVFFITNEDQQQITVSVLSDDIPEGQEDIKITLISATNGRIGANNEFTLTIAPNDNPHGTVQFAKTNYTVDEFTNTNVHHLSLNRIDGTYGELRVYYSTQQINIASKIGDGILGYFDPPQVGFRGVTGQLVNVTQTATPLQTCAEACVYTDACLVFEFSIISNISLCMWFPALSTSPLLPDARYWQYIKNVVKVQEMQRSIATAGADFGVVTNGYVLIPDGSNTGSIPVSILADSIPELDESFEAKLTRIEVTSTGASAKYPPQIGSPSMATVTIAKNDNAFGIFRIYSDNPAATNGGLILPVEEKPQLAVDLIVERQGGSIGEVSVDWYVNTTIGTAVYNVDYIADGATLQFTPGQTRRMITLTVIDDALPEENKTLSIQLQNPQGGAEVEKGAGITVIILENDNVAGVLGFDTTAVLAKEGDSFSLKIKRSAPAKGTVMVDWEIQGLDGLKPQDGFVVYNGSFTFQPGEMSKTLALEVKTDDRPETNEEYQVVLKNVMTIGIGITGAAMIDPMFERATVTVQGSNDPHGVIQFSDSSLNVRTEEQNVVVDLQVDRKFGAIGTVRVSYDIAEGSVSATSDELIAATANDDFIAVRGYIDIVDSSAAGTISVQIKDDTLPEVDEVFIVTLTGVALVGSPDSSSMPPRLGSSGTVAQIIINANDGTKGVAKFSSDSVDVVVDEITKNISLTVFRDKGTFGNVSLFYYAQSIVDGTTQGTDFNIAPQELFFLAKEDHKLIILEILDDDIPEPDEMFQVILSNPRDGLELGEPSRANITIMSNDGASGEISFENDALVTIDESPADDNSESNKAKLRIIRGPGVYGVVNIAYQVILDRAENSNDLSPMQGYITFQDLQDSLILELTALDDSLPEKEEQFIVRLFQPSNKATLGRYKEKTVIIRSNDSPNGLLQIYVRYTQNRTISVDENFGLINFDVKRTQGLDGTVSVDLATQPGTAIIDSDLTKVTLIPVEFISTSQVTGWHSFVMNDTLYILMLTSFRVGELTTGVGSNGTLDAINVDRLYYTTMFKWQGQLVPVQTIETDVATSATTFTIDGTTYLVITNMGNVRRFQTLSRVYKVESGGVLLVLQNIQTKGAKNVEYFMSGSDHFLVFSNSKDDNSDTLVSVDVYKWDTASKMFDVSPWQSLNNQGTMATAVFQLEGVLYMAVANNYNSQTKTYNVDSIIYKFGSDQKFSEHQRIQTAGAVDVGYLSIHSLSLLVFANNRGDVVSSPQLSIVYRWDSTAQMFFRQTEIETNRVESVSAFIGIDDTGYLAVANGIGNSVMYAWDVQDQNFITVWTGPPALQLYPVEVAQATGPLMLMPIADIDAKSNATLYQFMKIKNSDFAPRTVTLTYEPGQTSRSASVMVLQDDIPEDTETFYVTINNPSNGAEIGPLNKITVNILSNDNAHGIIEIAPDSREIIVQELNDRDNAVQINVVRQYGFFGRVVIKWSATGDQSGLSDITPLEGQVEFANGQSVATITLTILNDNLAELPEVTYVRLTSIVEAGTALQDRGAQIGSNNVAKVIVQANDSPYGVVLWERATVTVAEPESTDKVLTLYIVREQGLMGELEVSFQTGTDLGQPVDRRATSGEDYVATQGAVIMQENVTRVPAEVVIKHDAVPEPGEVFLVNITNVMLRGNTPPAGAEPSVKIPGNIVMVTVSENDGIRGIIQFNVTTNIEGRIDTYEEYGRNTTVSLRVSRSVGFLGDVTVTWQAEPREATAFDFSPSSGTINFADGQESTFIVINILDDSISETMETFEVKLLVVSSGTSEIGPANSVRVAILKNDSPNGLFRFVQTEVRVKESVNMSDPAGEATLNIERIQGTEGVVQVQWRLNAEGAFDFLEPHTDTVLFAQGERNKTITLRTKPDTILEGEEVFRISLITADNNADISHTHGDATIIIEPDPGARGIISILPEYRRVYIGEPGESSPTYNGKVEVMITRGLGIYGDIAVTWSLTPRETSAFLQVEGTVRLVDLQQTAVITLQAIDDTTAEQLRTYTLQITSATGGASVSTVPGSYVADVVFVASDYPHGLFQFTLPDQIVVLEDDNTVKFPVVRTMGSDSQVLLSYTTSPGTAESYSDFYPAANTLVFQQDEIQQMIEVRIIADDLPEGPEMFYVNLTSVRLMNPSDINETVVNGLSLYMMPTIGSPKVKTVIIDKNDNAEGTIEFDPVAVQFRVSEESGIAKVPLIRIGGNYGEVTVNFITNNLTATPGVDYVVPESRVIFQDGQRNATIDVTIRDDSEMEFDESFTITLLSVTGGAQLGSSTIATVTVIKSDFPNGKFGFSSNLDINKPNPETQISETLTIERTGGLSGKQIVYWRIMGPNNAGQVLLETNDIAYISNNIEVTSGNLTWEDNSGGQKNFTLFIKPFSTWEIQKTFIMEIYQIQGSPADVGDGEISVSSGQVFITIQKFGDPNGIIQFSGIAQTERVVDEPVGTGPLELRFPVSREAGTGTIGSIQIFWEVTGPFDSTHPDFQPRNGSVVLGDSIRDGAIAIQILPDEQPELTESYTLVLTSVQGGAEINVNYSRSVFKIRYNNYPHGLFGLQQDNQEVIVDPVSLDRYVRLNISRYYGTFGSVIVTFSVQYDQSQAGIALSNSVGTIQFSNGTAVVTADIKIEGNGFLEIGSTFSASLTDVQYFGVGVTEPPGFQAGETKVKVYVSAIAANSEVGFKDLLVSINENTNTATLVISRVGLYGTINVDWQNGFRNGETPSGFVTGEITPATGAVTIPHGIESKNFTVSISARVDRSELFALHLPQAPTTSINGGARLSSNNLVQLEPNGVIRFAPNSTNPTASEMDGRIHLMVQRIYGSESKIEVTYRSQSVTAIKDLDFITTETNAVVMEPGQISALITLQVIQDNQPEEEETFHINLTHVEKYPTDIVPRISPRLSSIAANSVVHVEESNDPYGVLCLVPSSYTVQEEHIKVNLTVQRTGGVFGIISVLVRTVGGGETWTSQIVPMENPDANDTITQVLGNRKSTGIAMGGQDYELLDTTVVFQQYEEYKNISVVILSDKIAEPDETVIVYLTQPTGGARIAEGTPDGGKKGFCVITILQNDLSNGIIGFDSGSKVISVNEDTSPTFTLTLSRTNAVYGQVEVSWIAKKSANSTEAEDAVLANQLERTAGTTICPALQNLCTFNVTLKNDAIPEDSETFVIKLLSVRHDAQLDQYSLVSTVTVEPSDYIRGLIQFTSDSRLKIIGNSERSTVLKVERLKGKSYDVSVSYETIQMGGQEFVRGFTVSPALINQDFQGQSGSLVFEKDQQALEFIDISLTPVTASSDLLPKQFYVRLMNPTNGASLNTDPMYSEAIIRIVEDDRKVIWTIVTDRDTTSLQNDTNILQTIALLDPIAKTELDDIEVTLMEDILQDIINEGKRRPLPDQTFNQLLNVLCNLMNPNKNDATRGRSSLTTLMEDLAYAMMTGKPCPTPVPDQMTSLQCLYAKLSAGRWELDNIKGFQYAAQRSDQFTVPSEITDPPTPHADDCYDFHMIEYNSEQWFLKPDQTPLLLSNKIFSFGIKGKQSSYSESPSRYKIHTQDRRIATRFAKCVYYDFAINDWVSPSGICTVNNNLELAVDDYVDCSCKHLTHYAVKAEVLDPGLVGYSVWFYVSCFICMTGMALAVLVHHICASLNAMFSANLLMHLCFACFGTQLCYVVDAYTSPSEVLVSTLDQDNYRCIIMGQFLHYFFLTQFTWMMAQAINFWKILVMNDEHTERKYVFFFLMGWGLPVVIIAIFYVVTFSLYKYVYNMPQDFIYGDVNNNGEICFITSSYAALGGVIIPALLMLLVVGIIFVKAFQVTPQWQAYDDIYRGRYNINEIRTLLCFWAVISITWLWGGLHMAYGQAWMLVLFCLFNILQGIMAIVLYTFLRNPLIQQCLGPQAKAYSVSVDNLHENGTVPPDISHHNNTFATEIGSLKGSRASLLNESWDRDSLPSKSTTMKVKRTLPSSGNIYVTPPILVQTPDAGNNDRDFDDLLYVLKSSGSYSASEVNSLDSDKFSEISNKIDKYEMRRISIADTHL